MSMTAHTISHTPEAQRHPAVAGFNVPLLFCLDLHAWATEYGIPLAEAHDDVMTMLTTAAENGALVAMIAANWPMMRPHLRAAGPVTTTRPAGQHPPTPASPQHQPHPAPPATGGECEHRRLQIPHTVPVEAVIDLTTRTVQRVVVIDESISPDPDGEYRCNDCFTSLPAASVAVRSAREIAADPGREWPGWDLGW